MSLLVDDRELLRAFRAGEGLALTRVFDHYAPYIATLLRRGFSFHAGGRTVRFHGYQELFDVEDGMQEVFRRAFSESARHNYDGLRPYKAYLGSIARNTVINTYLANARRLERYGYEEVEQEAGPDDWSAADDALDSAAAEPSGHPERDATTQELRDLVTAFKTTLAERELRVFALRFGERLSHTEIAARSGLSASKIKTTEAHIRKELLRFLNRHGYFRESRTRPGLRAARLQGEKT